MSTGIKLSSSTTVEKYQDMKSAYDKEGIADFVLERFTERYIKPLRVCRERKHGFCTMAICCLMIEALESFWCGWPDSTRRSKEAFCSFFDRSPNLSVFQDYAGDFYKNVRCGILHQAETRNGWRIRRDGLLFNPETKTINATKFHDQMEKCLQNYVGMLKESDWEEDIWNNLQEKMKSIITNCEAV